MVTVDSVGNKGELIPWHLFHVHAYSFLFGWSGFGFVSLAMGVVTALYSN